MKCNFLYGRKCSTLARQTMSARRPTAFTSTAEQLLASKPRPPVSRSNSLESVHRHFVASCSKCREHVLNQKVISLEEELRKAELETERFRLDNAKLLQQSQTGNSRINTIQRTLSEFRKENSSLKLEVQRNERFRAELGQQLLSVRQENDQFRQTIGQEKKSIVQENDRIRKENASMGKRLNSLEPEAATLRNEKARLEHEEALLKKEFEEERVSLQKKIAELEWDEEQHKPLLQKVDTLQQNVEKLQQSLDRETEKLKETQQREQFLQNELNKFKDSSYSCPRTKCMETRTERTRLARKFETKCERLECVTAKANLEEAKNRIRQMEKKKCNSTLCQNQQLKDMNETVGSKIRIGDQEYSHSEALQQLLQRVEMKHTDQSDEVRSLRSYLQKMQQEKQLLLEKLDAAVGSNAGRCTRSDCQIIQEQLRRMQSESVRQGRSAARDMTIMSGGDYDEPLQEFNEVFTDPDELLGMLEKCLESFVAKKMLCEIFQWSFAVYYANFLQIGVDFSLEKEWQHAYKLCKEAALQRIMETLKCLFTVSEDKSKKDIMGEISRAYGLLLHVSGLKSDETVCRDVSLKIVTALIENESYNQAGKALQAKQEYLLKCVEVAWKFVTLPSPIIACRPQVYIPQIVDLEYGFWDESTPEAKLIYTRPVVYRCYDGHRAEKGMVANTDVFKIPETQKKGLLQKFVGYVFQREQ